MEQRMHLVKVTKSDDYSRFRVGDYIVGDASKISLLINHSNLWHPNLNKCTETTYSGVMRSKGKVIHYVRSINLGEIRFDVLNKYQFEKLTDKGKLIKNKGYYNN